MFKNLFLKSSLNNLWVTEEKWKLENFKSKFNENNMP